MSQKTQSLVTQHVPDSVGGDTVLAIVATIGNTGFSPWISAMISSDVSFKSRPTSLPMVDSSLSSTLSSIYDTSLALPSS